MSGDGSGRGSDGVGAASSPQQAPRRSSNDVNSDEHGKAPNTSQERAGNHSTPPLPPRPANLDLLDDRAQTSGGSLKLPKRASRPQLLSKATTALSLADVHTQSRVESSRASPSTASRAASRKQSFANFARFGSDAEDSASIKSYAPTLETGLETESLLEGVNKHATSAAWNALSANYEKDNPFEQVATIEDDVFSLKVRHEFDELEDYDLDSTNEETLVSDWKAKLKQFFILSGSGKPIYSRHGNDQMISNYIGVIQTLISFYQGAKDDLKGFTAGTTRFVVLHKGPLNLVAISRLGESDAQLRVQLESMYMQILSTLTLPSLERMFSNRPSTDLRRPLQGTDVLLDGLADGFTRGSPSTLLSALECLRLRKTHRMIINDTLLKVKTPNLLYGLVLAAGRLVSVVRPKKHSLHPGDLHLIFNMLFEAGSVKAGGGENWIPLCLPGFNNTGFLYMYVSFFSTHESQQQQQQQQAQSDSEERPPRPTSPGTRPDDELAIVLISANKEAFHDLRNMRNDLVTHLRKNGSMTAIKNAVRKGYAACTDIVPGTVLRHFLYKSRGNVQFTMPSFEPCFEGLVARRRLMSLYHNLHESVHSRAAHLKVHHAVARDATALAWETPLFELYCVAGPSADRAALAQGANRVVQWIRREEERVFIIGGAVF